ncbi:hypothetical protein JHN59_14215 [Streptomyces sp. MBT49]|uniref:hypothetical protein n=1 Tax=Streptomyces sp. MBT49 TaxID=1488380 RepID=UPI00190AF011|nr:hypothetical protein [Streptomyces sp. MBT49]MBK3625978.1 hypothetical protein [Streptomyces sp. MBT49]
MDLTTLVLVVLGFLLPSVVELLRSVAARNHAAAQRMRARGEAEVVRARLGRRRSGERGRGRNV